MGSGDDFHYLGPALAALRTVSRKSVTAVGKELGVSASVLLHFENGEQDMNAQDLLRYLKAVNASLKELHLVMGVLKLTRGQSATGDSGDR